MSDTDTGRYAILKDGSHVLIDRVEDALERCDYEHGAVLYHRADDELLAEVDLLRGHLRRITATFYEFDGDPACMGPHIDAADLYLNRRLAKADERTRPAP